MDKGDESSCLLATLNVSLVLIAVAPVSEAVAHTLNIMQGVDIFSKDFLFIPIHDALHWSLIIVCHPGLSPGSDRRPYILHLDSMSGRFLLINVGGRAVHVKL